jgi:DNA-binding CsgD family transcriptional regulator
MQIIYIMDEDKSLLTEQQYKIACLAASGKTRKQMADELYLATRTIDSHLRIIYKKLDIKGLKALPLAMQELSAHKLANYTWDDKLDFLCNYPMTTTELMRLSGCSRTVAYAYLKERGLLVIEKRGCKGGLKKLTDKHSQPYGTVWNRIARLGWSVEEALTTPVHARKCK